MSILEKTTHVLLIAVSCVSLAMLTRQFVRGTTGPSGHQIKLAPASGARPYDVGDELAIGNIAWQGSQTSVVLVVRKDCQYCEASLPFYHRLDRFRATLGKHVSLIVAAPDPPDVVRAVLAKAGIVPDKVINSDLAAMRVKGTPTVFVVGTSGSIKYRVIGKLSSAGEEALLDKIRDEEQRRVTP